MNGGVLKYGQPIVIIHFERWDFPWNPPSLWDAPMDSELETSMTSVMNRTTSSPEFRLVYQGLDPWKIETSIVMYQSIEFLIEFNRSRVSHMKNYGVNLSHVYSNSWAIGSSSFFVVPGYALWQNFSQPLSVAGKTQVGFRWGFLLALVTGIRTIFMDKTIRRY